MLVRLIRNAAALWLVTALGAAPYVWGSVKPPVDEAETGAKTVVNIAADAQVKADCRALQCRYEDQRASVSAMAVTAGATLPDRSDYTASLVPASGTDNWRPQESSEGVQRAEFPVRVEGAAVMAIIAAISAPATNSEACNQQSDPLGQMQGCATPPKPPCNSEGTALTPGVTCQAPEPPMLGLVGAALALLALTLRRKPQQA